MSIISEALKKTEEQLQKNTAKAAPIPTPFGIKLFLPFILILLAGILLASAIFTLLKHKTQEWALPSFKQNPKSQTIQISLKNILPQVPAVNPLPLAILPSQPPEEKSPSATSFILNGIFLSNDGSYALINNQIVREKDTVDGAKVVLITENNVRLDNLGQKITLSTSR